MSLASLLLATAASGILLSAAESQGHPDHFLWTVRAPSGAVALVPGESILVALVEDGDWLAVVDAYYLHESPFGPWPWVSRLSVVYSTVVFKDGFEDGTTNAWH